MVSPWWRSVLHHHPPARTLQGWLCHCGGVTSSGCSVSLNFSFNFPNRPDTSVLLSLAVLKGIVKAYVISLGITFSYFFLHVLNTWFLICFPYHYSYLISQSVAKGFITWWLLNFSWILNCPLVNFSIIIFPYDMHCFQNIQTISKLLFPMIFWDDDKQPLKVAEWL